MIAQAAMLLLHAIPNAPVPKFWIDASVMAKKDREVGPLLFTRMISDRSARRLLDRARIREIQVLGSCAIARSGRLVNCRIDRVAPMAIDRKFARRSLSEIRVFNLRIIYPFATVVVRIGRSGDVPATECIDQFCGYHPPDHHLPPPPPGISTAR